MCKAAQLASPRHICFNKILVLITFQGKDDLRQDAVMQQVFTMLNTLLKNNKETQNRKLLIRTYKVSGSQ
jgi:hypothetical protein